VNSAGYAVALAEASLARFIGHAKHEFLPLYMLANGHGVLAMTVYDGQLPADRVKVHDR